MLKFNLYYPVCVFLISFFSLLSFSSYAQNIDAGFTHSLAICSNGTVKACGGNPDGQFGNGTKTNSTTPITINITGVISVVASSSHSIFVKSDGTVWACG